MARDRVFEICFVKNSFILFVCPNAHFFALLLSFFDRRVSPGIFSKRHSTLHSWVAKNLAIPLASWSVRPHTFLRPCLER